MVVRKEGETELEYLRRKEIAFGLWQAEMLEVRAEMQAEIAEYKASNAALKEIAEALFVLRKYALKETRLEGENALFTDLAQFKNVMAFHGVDGYAKKKKVKA